MGIINKTLNAKQVSLEFDEFRQVYRIDYTEWETDKGRYSKLGEPLYVVALGMSQALQHAIIYLDEVSMQSHSSNFHIESVTFISAVIELREPDRVEE